MSDDLTRPYAPQPPAAGTGPDARVGPVGAGAARTARRPPSAEHGLIAYGVIGLIVA